MKHSKHASEIFAKKHMKTLEKVIAKHTQHLDKTLTRYV
jgi:hypothetical protein